MKLALTHNLRCTDTEAEAEFDTQETIDAIVAALRSSGHDVEPIEVSGPTADLVARLEACSPDLIFNIAEGDRGRTREAFYPALFEQLGIPYTGSDAYVLTTTLDKHLTKLLVSQGGVRCPRGSLVRPDDLARAGTQIYSGLPFPCLVKPNHEGSSKGISDDSVAENPAQLASVLESALRAYPAGVLVEEFIGGRDISVFMLEGLGEDGILTPVEFVLAPDPRSRYNLLDYAVKHDSGHRLSVRCPPDVSPTTVRALRESARTSFRILGLHDLGRVDFRLGDDGRLVFLEVNALPTLARSAAGEQFLACEGESYENVLAAVVRSAALRWKLP